MKKDTRKGDTVEVNELKLKIKEIERSEKQLMDTILSGGFQEDLLILANQKAAQLKRDRIAFQERMEELKSKNNEADQIVNLAGSWKKADDNRKKEVVMLMIYRIMISEDGNTKIIWNI